MISLLGCGLAGAGSIFYNGFQQPYLNYNYQPNYLPASLGYNANYGYSGYNGYNGLTYGVPQYPALAPVAPAPVAPYNTASQV